MVLENIMASWKLTNIIKWLTNAGFFYLGWLACIHQAVGPYPYLGPAIVLGILIYHFTIYKNRWPDIILCLTLAIFGTFVDTIYILIGMLEYKGGYSAFPSIAPLWITALWSLYAISVNHSLRWLNYHVLLASSLGAAGGISSYLVGIKLDAATANWGTISTLSVIGCVWAIVVPLSLKFGTWLRTGELSS